jgi:hypothetical protein
MARRNYDFAEDDKGKVLLWCARHCCLCGRFVGVGIELAHLDSKSRDIDDAIPVCFDCHAAIGHYNASHPRGRKYTTAELKARRDQVYDEHTRRLVPHLVYQEPHSLPKVGFHIRHSGEAPAARIRVTLDTYINGKLDNSASPYVIYRGVTLWHLNPGDQVFGNFDVPPAATADDTRLKVGVRIVVHDVYGREHSLLPVAYGYRREQNDWYLDPIDPELSAAQDLASDEQSAST